MMLLLASSVCGLFKWRQLEPKVILLAVGWYLRFSLSYRDVDELLAPTAPRRRSDISAAVEHLLETAGPNQDKVFTA
jgi:transposase-like protein